MTQVTQQSGGSLEASELLPRLTGVAVTELDSADHLAQADALFREVWRSPDPPVATHMMKAVAHAGGLVAGALDPQGRVVAVSVALLATGSPAALHSHIAAVAEPWRRAGVGFALKQYQRQWALDRGMDEVRWTYDPLVRRNAFFNLVKLGATVDSFLENFYGHVTDGINAGDDTDRFLVRWRLNDPAVVAAAAGRGSRLDERSVTAPVLTRIGNGRPRRHDVVPAADDDVGLWIPDDIEDMRRRRGHLAALWRREFREAVTAMFAQGFEVNTVTHDGWYVMRKQA